MWGAPTCVASRCCDMDSGAATVDALFCFPFSVGRDNISGRVVRPLEDLRLVNITLVVTLLANVDIAPIAFGTTSM